ncbi:MAG: membrane protein insertase YidC [Kiritimatiellae bacterium]|nr:membrane protein insertase YidC [Kiritimatiellia bacterium]MDD5520931.1 membrane protein insertase YidC [Kiritimatiellia bacterium]
MNKFETTMVAILFVVLGLWWYGYKTYFAPPVQPVKSAVSQVDSNRNVVVQSSSNTLSKPAVVTAREEIKVEKKVETVMGPDEGHKETEQIITLSNDKTDVKLSSWGGAIISVTLKKYRETLDKKSGQVKFDWSAKPALAYSGIPGLSQNSDFKVTRDETGRKVSFERALSSGLEFVRTITLGDGYQLQVAESLKNKSAVAIKLPAYELNAGSMKQIRTVSGSMGYEYLGIDSFSLSPNSGKKICYWANKGPDGDTLSLSARLQPAFRQGGGCSMFKPKLTEPLPVTTNIVRMLASDWVAVKNKFFVQILAPKGGSAGITLNVRREVPQTENPAISQTWVQTATLEEVSTAMRYRERELAPGESLFNEISYYAGPKEYAQLKLLGNRQDDVMEFGYWLYPISKLLLVTLNFLYKIIPNYGVAVILLTILVRIVFWPVTHKSTESMKKMQQIQPLINQVREKYKDKPQKMNQEVMAIYKEQKVNPMSGCLPILVQIPVFIALFTVLRSAVELRFSEFLWIRDLSEPENLLAGIIPFGLNILPIAMAATMFWQQKMTPTAGDPQQQKMMLYMMPIMMLFMFYKMASALVLYWTVSQILSIYQLYRQKRKADEEEKAKHAKA